MPGGEGGLEGEEKNGACHFVGGAIAPHRRDGVAERLELGAFGIAQARHTLGRGVDEAGTDRVDADAARQKLDREHGSEGDECRLGGAVDAHAGVTALVGNR